MANFLRFGDRLINLEYTAEIDATTVKDGLATIHMAEGRSIVIDGETALCVGNFVGTFTPIPPRGPIPDGGPTHYSAGTGADPAPDEVRTVDQRE